MSLTRIPFVLLPLFVLAVGLKLNACPFCNAVSQTLRQEMLAMDAVVIATPVDADGFRTEDNGEVTMRVAKVLKGGDLVKEGQEIQATYFGEVSKDRRFLIQGVDPPQLQWASTLPLSERSEKYVSKVAQLGDDAAERLRFFQQYLEDEESMLSRDAYDEFASAPYDAVKQLEPLMDHDQLISWITDPEISTNHKRLYLTMLGVCGDEKDLPILEKMMRSTQKSSRSGLDALIACYLTLAGERGLPLIDELFLANQKAAYADTYAAIMAIRFHGTEGDTIARSALVESLHHVLDRKDLADLVIPDLARWSDWSQVERLTDLFINADPDNNWVRVPVVNYLRACPLPEAKEALKKLEEVDPESVRRANTFFSIPVARRFHRDEPLAPGLRTLSGGRNDHDRSVLAAFRRASAGRMSESGLPAFLDGWCFEREMSAELQMTSAYAAESTDFPYRALSRGAVVSIILAVVSLPGLVPVFSPLLALTPVGMIAAAVALRSIRRYPREFSGSSLATAGLIANLTILVGGVGLHTYIYLTEVPEGYTRIGFYELQASDGAPAGPTPKAIEIDGESIFLKGYIHPSSGSGMLRQFILVPDLGTCCFGGQPSSNDMIEVTLTGGQTTRAGLIKKKLAGKFMLNRAPVDLVDFENPIFYQLRVDQIR